MRRRLSLSGITSVVLGIVVLTDSAPGQATERVSVDSSGAEGNGAALYPSVSANGMVVAFESNSFNLVAGDTNGAWDCFVHDRTTRTTVRVSVDSAGIESNGNSFAARVSADGKFVAFMSDATNLVAGDTGHHRDIFVHELATGITQRVSLRSNGVAGRDASFEPAISADGRYVTFFSLATNLVPFDTNGFADIFVHDRTTGVTERVSVDSAGAEGDSDSSFPAISGDGQVVAFYSFASNLVPNDTNATFDVFIHDRPTGTTLRVSVDSAGIEGDALSYGPVLSADGLVVAFKSDASNLVAGDFNGVRDVFVHDRSTALTERASVDSSGVEANDLSLSPSLSADGQIVAFFSAGSNLVSNDSNGKADAFLRHRATGLTERVSLDAAGAEVDGDSLYLWLAEDGRTIVFESVATNLVPNDTNTVSDIFARCLHDASWFNYGVGWSGTFGVPTMTASADPAVGTDVTITITNSLGAATPALVLLGFGQTNLPTSNDGSLLVVPLLFIPLFVPAAGFALSGTVPTDSILCGLFANLQTLEVDPGASKGLSFTDGLELRFGH